MHNLNSYEHAEFVKLLTAFTTADGVFFHDEKRYITVANVPHSEAFTKVAITYCSPKDIYCKTRGKYEALKKLDRKYFILIPADAALLIK